MTDVIWCTPGRPAEADWIAEIGSWGHSVVRRCIEATDLIAAASIDERAALVVDVAAPRLSSDIVASISARTHRVLVFIADNDDALARARSWLEGARGAVVDIRTLSGPAAIAETIAQIVDVSPESQDQSAIEVATVAQGQDAVQRPAAPLDSAAGEEKGSVVVVWGPHGSPGRSTIALGLAEAWARSGQGTCLIDADTIAPSLAHLVGMTEDVSGLLLAARYADQGALDSRSLGSACRELAGSLWLLSGIGSADRWTQARSSALDRVWRECARHFDRVVIDVGALLHTEEVDDPFPGIGMQRDAATLSALRASDSVVAVTRPDVVGVARLIEDLPEVFSMITHSNVDVIVNRVPRRSRSVEAEVRTALGDAGVSARVYALADDVGIGECLRKGALLSEVASATKSRRVLNKISGAVAA